MSDKKSISSYRHIWSVLCQSSSVDKDTNNLFLFNILEEITLKQPSGEGNIKEAEMLSSKKIIAIPFNFEIVSMLERLDDKEKGPLIKEAELEFTDSYGKSLLRQNFEMNFPKGFRRLRYKINMNGLNIITVGTYHFHFRIRESKNSPFEEVAKLPLDIKFS